MSHWAPDVLNEQARGWTSRAQAEDPRGGGWCLKYYAGLARLKNTMVYCHTDPQTAEKHGKRWQPCRR